MLKKIINIFISFLLVLPFFMGMTGFQEVKNGDVYFQKTCDMDHSNPHLPKCPLCPSSSSINPYLRHEAGVYLPSLTRSFILITVNTLSDQGFVKSIFHPPTSLL